jgi:hypothetical protein
MLLCRISCELAGCVHQPIVGSGQTNLSHLYFSRLSLAMPAKLNFFKTLTSVQLVQVGPCPHPLEYQAATSHTGRQPCRVKSLYMKRFWCVPPCVCCGGRTDSPGGEGDGGSIFWKTREIGLPSYCEICTLWYTFFTKKETDKLKFLFFKICMSLMGSSAWHQSKMSSSKTNWLVKEHRQTDQYHLLFSKGHFFYKINLAAE